MDAISLDVDERQVDYYTRAIKLLGFLSEDGRLNGAGRALLALDERARKARLAIAFEQSVCGQAWMAWFRAKSLCNVDPKTAGRFLREASRLDGEMLRVRKGTLKAWWREFIPSHPALQSAPSTAARNWRPEALGQMVVLDTRESARVVQALGVGTSLLRVATGFLSVSGFEILEEPLREAWMQLIVGYDSALASVEDILSNFSRSLEAGPPTPSKKSTIRNLYRNVSTGPVNVRYFDPRFKPHVHAKVYLFDEFAGYVTSANLSRSGLRTNIEGGYVVRDASALAYLIERFDALFEDQAKDLRPRLLQEIERSWVFEPLAEPYILYLRVLLAFYPQLEALSRRVGRRLAKFQELIVGAVLHDLRAKRGALLVSPTGTGKTVMSAHIATVLHQKREIDRIFVICPNERLKRMWKIEANRFRVHMEVITHGIVQGKGKPAEGVDRRLERELSDVSERDLVIIDESHVFRNQETNGFKNFQRLLGERPQECKPQLLLLTATPMSKDIDDLNAQLKLIGVSQLLKIDEVAQCLGVVNVTLPFIIKYFGTSGTDGQGTALEYPEGLRYFGGKVTSTRTYPPPSEAAFEYISRMRLRFRKSPTSGRKEIPEGLDIPETGRPSSAGGLVQLMLLRRAESSPQAAKETIERLLNPPDDWPLEPVDPVAFHACLTELDRMLASSTDTKLLELANMLRTRPRRQRVLIFSMWAATVKYLAEKLPALLTNRERIDSITGDMPPKQRGEIIQRFAPTAQGRSRHRRRDDLDILVATDAIAEGENLQDADVVVNYDLPWTPLLLIQRVGRVDRPTKHRRKIELWNFYPGGEAFERQVQLWKRLGNRAELYARLARTHVLGEHDRQLENLTERDLGLIRDYGEDKITFEDLRDHYVLPTTELLRDRAMASKDDSERAMALPPGTRSCKTGSQPGLFALLSVDGKMSCVFKPDGAEAAIESPGPFPHEVLMRYVRAEPNTPLAPLPEGFDENLVALVEAFAERHDVESECVTVVVAAAIVQSR